MSERAILIVWRAGSRPRAQVHAFDGGPVSVCGRMRSDRCPLTHPKGARRCDPCWSRLNPHRSKSPWIEDLKIEVPIGECLFCEQAISPRKGRGRKRRVCEWCVDEYGAAWKRDVRAAPEARAP